MDNKNAKVKSMLGAYYKEKYLGSEINNIIDNVLHTFPLSKTTLIHRVYMCKKCTLEGGAAYCSISYTTAKRWKKELFDALYDALAIYIK